MMEFLKTLVDLFLKLDEHLKTVLDQFGPWTYVLLFVVIFAETGLVVTPFLPGDSLLFAAGLMAGIFPDSLNIVVLLIALTIAAILGDTLNYWFGRWLGPRVFSGKLWFLKQEHLAMTQAFYDRHGGKAIILARFAPIIRTFAPFLAGVGTMNYRLFIAYNIIGGIAWVAICTLAGYLFGNIPFVKENFEFICLGIVFVSILPMAIEIWRSRSAPNHSQPGTDVSTANPPG